MWYDLLIVLTVCVLQARGKLGNEEDGTRESGDHDLEDSGERIGAAVTQIFRHPYAASLLKNDTYICSAVILNTFWIVTQSKCFEVDIISSYVTHKNIHNYTARVGSSYNNKGGTLYKIAKLINNFDLQVSAVKVSAPFEFSSRVQAVRLPGYDEDVSLGYLASIIGWTPIGHIRIVNAPVIETSICETNTKLLPSHYICVSGVQDPNRHFCRNDNGGAVIQNNTLVGLSSFLHTCAVYSRTHAFPKVSSFARWLDSVIWDEHNRPTTDQAFTTQHTSIGVANTTANPPENRSPYFGDPRKFMLTLPFDPIKVPLEPAGDNSVISRMSLYEAYLQNLVNPKTSTTVAPSVIEEQKRNGVEMEWMQKYGNVRMPQMYQEKKYQNYEFN